MSDYGTFESLGHEGYDKKIAAEKRDEALDRAAARIVEDTGDFFRNAASRDDFNQRWDMGITNVRRSAAKETETSDDTMNAIRDRVAALTLDTKPKPRKRATRHASTFLLWDDYDTHEHAEMSTGGHRVTYDITYNSDGTVSLWYNDSGRLDDDQLIGNHATVDEAKQAADEHYHANRTARHSRRKRRTATHVTWEDDGFGTDMFGNEYTISLGGAGEYDLTVNDGLTTTTVGRYPTREQAQDAARTVYARRTARRKQASLAWTDGAPGFFEDGTIQPTIRATGPDGTLYIIAPENYSYTLQAIKGSVATVLIEGVGEFQAMQVAEDHANGRTARRKSAALQWEDLDGTPIAYLRPDSDDYYSVHIINGQYYAAYHLDYEDKSGWRVGGPYATEAEAKEGALADAIAEGWITASRKRPAPTNTAHRRTARRKAASVAPEQVTIDGKTGYMYQTDGLYDYLVYPNAEGTYWDLYSKYRTKDRFVWSEAGLSLDEAQQEAVYQVENDGRFTDNPDREAPKATATTMGTPKGDTIRIASRRKSSALTWEQDGVGAYADKGDNTAYHIFKYPGDEYFSIKYYSDRMNGDGRIFDYAATLDEAKSVAEQEDASGRTARRRSARRASRRNQASTNRRRKQAWSLGADGMTYTSDVAQDGFDCPSCGTGNKLGFSRCACGKQWNSYTIEGVNGERRMVAREVEARPEAVLAKRRQSGRTANRKTALVLQWSPNSDYIEDRYTAEAMGHSFVVEYNPSTDLYEGSIDGEIVMEQETHWEAQNSLASLAKERFSRRTDRRRTTQNRKGTMNSSQHDMHRRAQRKQAGVLQWTQDPQEPKSWSAESGQWAFDIVIGTDLWVFKDYQDGDMPLSVKTYPDTDSAKRAAEDIANGIADPDQGVTARRANRVRRAQENSDKLAYQAGRRAAQRNLTPSPAAPLAYLTGYRDYLRSTIKRG